MVHAEVMVEGTVLEETSVGRFSVSCRMISVCNGEGQELITSQEKYANSILHHIKHSLSTSLLLLKSRLLERCISKSLAT